MEEVSLVPQGSTLLLPMGVVMDGCGLRVAGRPSLEDCITLAGSITSVAGRVETISRFMIGDLLCWSEGKHGERYADFEAATGLSYQSLADLKYVASRVDISRRREKLSVSHHREVAPLAPELQDQWLSHAQENGLSSRELREQVKAWQAEERQLEERRQLSLSQADPVQVPPPADMPTIGAHPQPVSRVPEGLSEDRIARTLESTKGMDKAPSSRPSPVVEPVSRTLTRPSSDTARTLSAGGAIWRGPIWRAYFNYEVDGKPGTMTFEIEEVETDRGEAYEIRSELTEFGRVAGLPIAKDKVAKLAAEALLKVGGFTR